jgi:hypothetical protein
MFNFPVIDEQLLLPIFQARTTYARDTALVQFVDAVFGPIAQSLAKQDNYQAVINKPANFPVPEAVADVYLHATKAIDSQKKQTTYAAANKNQVQSQFYQNAKNYLEREVPILRRNNAIKALAELNYPKFYKAKAKEFSFETTLEQAVNALAIEKPDYAGFGEYLTHNDESRKRDDKREIDTIYFAEIKRLHAIELNAKAAELKRNAEEQIKPLFESFITDVEQDRLQANVDQITFTAFDYRVDKDSPLYRVLKSDETHFVQFIKRYLSSEPSARKNARVQSVKAARQAWLDRPTKAVTSFFTGLLLVMTGQAFYRDFRDAYSRKDDTVLVPILGAPFAILFILVSSTVSQLIEKPWNALWGKNSVGAPKLDPKYAVKPYNKMVRTLGVIIGAAVALFSAVAVIGILGTIPGVPPAFASAGATALNQLGSFFGFFPATPWFTPFVIPMMYTTLATLAATAIAYYPEIEATAKAWGEKIERFSLQQFGREMAAKFSSKKTVDTELEPLNTKNNDTSTERQPLTNDDRAKDYGSTSTVITAGPDYMKQSTGSNQTESDPNNNNIPRNKNSAVILS